VLNFQVRNGAGYFHSDMSVRTGQQQCLILVPDIQRGTSTGRQQGIRGAGPFHHDTLCKKKKKKKKKSDSAQSKIMKKILKNQKKKC
jgi:hypothetical protein